MAVPRGMWGPSSPSRAGTHVAFSGSAECLSLDCQGSPPWLLDRFEEYFFHHIVCNMHCATDETGSHTGHNGTKVHERSANNLALLSGCSQGGCDLSQQHTRGKWHWPLGSGSERNKVRPLDLCPVVCIHVPFMGWKCNPLKLWASTLCSPRVLMYDLCWRRKKEVMKT